MPNVETSMGGSREGFPETVWSSVLSCRDPRSPERRAALNRLLSQYWRPVYKYLRAARRETIEDAKDLAQEFFHHLLERDLVSRYQPGQGRFRMFLKGALRVFLAEFRRDAAREKRGGGRPLLSLDVSEIETERFLADRERYTPEELFDRQWSHDLIAQSLLRLKAALDGEGKSDLYRAYEACELHPGSTERPSYEEAARRLDVPVSQIRKRLHLARQRLKDIIREKIAEYVASPDEIEEELRAMLSL